MEKYYYRRLDVYQNTKSLIIEIYKILEFFPKEEQYALCSQLRRAAVSIASNIAEGFGRYSEKERLYFLNNANGSLMEVSCQLDIAEALGYIDNDTKEKIDNDLLVITKQLASLRNKISCNTPTPIT